ncbi:MAG: trigger factor [Alistipes sp.]|nr:trigger factor [Rikenellaceae bacterium]MBO4992847.1 trigger factor [Alistipes sp.]MBR3792963.1 trigger factor [Alistipes sp.]MBR7114826.1 trigger factor [Alistipes sp.]MDO5487027.1 trigger factor [Rikenellaceae bacterium]
MKITREQREVGTSVLKVVVGEADYGEAVDKALREYKRKVNVPGFRPGMVPMGVVRKMYGKGVVAEQAYKLASNSVFEYLQKENIDYVGDVIPSEEQGDFDFENNTEHEFMFEIGEAPKIELELTKDDKLTYNKIKVEKEVFEAYKDNYLRRYGRLVDVEKVEKDEALTVTLDNGDMRIEGAYLGLISMSDEERKPFEGKKVGDTMEIDVNEVYKSASQRASILQVKEDELESINPKFTAEITQIRQFANPELNEEFFKMAFPDGKITSEAELDKYLNDEVEMEMGREADYLFTIRVRNFLMEKAALQMPEAFIKRWLYTINEGKFSMEDIEKDFDAFLKMFTWNYIQKHFIQTYELTVSPEEIEAEAKEFAKAQFAQYGMPSAPEEMLTNFAKQILENKEQAQKIYEKLYELKVVEYVKSKIKVTNKSVTSEEFAKLAQEM